MNFEANMREKLFACTMESVRFLCNPLPFTGFVIKIIVRLL